LSSAQIREAVVLADGRGDRDGDRAAALASVAGLPSLKRTLLTLARAGIKTVHVVLGFEAQRVRDAVADDPAYARAGLTIGFIENPDFDKGSGVALLTARPHVSGPFLLSTVDRVYDDALARAAAAADTSVADLWLCVARGATAVVDAETPDVRLTDGRVAEIGKPVAGADAIACGIYAASPKLFDTLGQGNLTLEDGVRTLVGEGRARAIEIGKAFWACAATPAARKQAQRGLFSRMRKPVDGLVSRTINRRISLAITGLFIDTKLTPNQMTIVANIIGAFGVYFTWQGTWGTLALGAFLVQMQSVLDGCDGEIARLKFQSSRMGEWLDNVLDDTVNVLYGLALGVASSKLLGSPVYTWLGIVSVVCFTIYNAGLYTQLALVHHTGNPFAFKWWYQTGPGDLGELLARPGLGNRILGFVRDLSRRDLFLFAFMILAFLRLPQIATVWYTALAVGYAAQMVVHLASGGLRVHAPKA
jgi:1L-myo-inositol 1-phosphate cytidylyltransferase / CDP-L-myo-inositol myo-inositolphosphotransferase